MTRQTFKPMKHTVLACLNFEMGRVRRYTTNDINRVYVTHAAELGPTHEGSLDELKQFLAEPPDELRA